MIRFYLFILVFLFISCQDFDNIGRDKEDASFFENINITENTDNNLSIATFNIKLGFCQICNPFSGIELGGDQEQLDRIVNFLNQMNLDIITLQEVGYMFDTTIIENQIEYIAERTRMNYAYGSQRSLEIGNDFLRGYTGNAILSRYEIIEIENFPTRAIDFSNQNHVLKARIKLNADQEIVVLSPHLEAGATNDERSLQINEILNQVENESDPTIIAGDFNLSYSPNNPFLNLLDANFLNTLENVSFEEEISILDTGTFISGSTIDFIFTSRDNFNIISASVAPEEFRDISDHFLYMSSLRLNQSN